MIKDVEKTIKKYNDDESSMQYKNLVYDLESFIIDMCHVEEKQEDVKRRSYIGKIKLSDIILDEKETELVFSAVRPVLIGLGIHESVKGFRIIERCVLEASRMYAAGCNYLMKDVYAVTAGHFSITAHNCERLCRYACKGIIPTREFAVRHPYFEELTHRTYEEVTVKELVDICVRYIFEKTNFKAVHLDIN